MRHPRPLNRAAIVDVVLALSFVFEGTSWLVAWKGFRPFVGERGYLAAIRRSKDPPQFVVLLEDTAALIGIAMAFAGTWGLGPLARAAARRVRLYRNRRVAVRGLDPACA